jgi:type VI secretion system secreted protein Hcp
MAKKTPIGFLQYKGIKGSSKNAGFEDQIPFHSYKHGIQIGLVTTVATSERHVASYEHLPFVIRKSMDKSSPLLYQSVTRGDDAKGGNEVVVSICELVGGKYLPVFTITLRGAFVSGIEYSEASGGDQEEVISFAYDSIRWQYEGVDETGKRTGAVEGAWDMKKGKPTWS